VSFSVFEQMRLNKAINLTHMTCRLAAKPITGKQGGGLKNKHFIKYESTTCFFQKRK